MRKAVSWLLAGLLALTVVVTWSGPAQAVLGCSADSLCFYDTGLSSEYPMIDHDDSDTSPGECFNMGSAHRNKTSYVRNWTDHQWTAFTSLNCVANPGPLYANTSGAMGGVWQNNIESYMRVG